MVKEQLVKEKIDYEYLDGSLSPKARKKAVQRFQSDEKCRIFLISLKAGSLGLTLTEADYVYLIDPWWNPAAENQASDRAHRIGQQRNVFVYKLICKGTVEEKIHRMQLQKQQLADSFLSKQNQNSGFTETQWKDLLSPIKTPAQ